MLSGGGSINYSFLQENLIDEVSIIMTPVTDGKEETKTIFEKNQLLSDIAPIGFKLKSVDIIEEDTLWLRYFADKWKEKGKILSEKFDENNAYSVTDVREIKDLKKES